jgi:hypothetical protein
MDIQPHRLARIAHASLLTIACTGALAQEPNPYYIGASQTFARESNLFRGASGVTVSDTLSVTSLLAGIDQPIGRQRLFADAAVRAGRFANNKQLNYTGGTLNAGADWEAAESLSGRISYMIDRTLAPTGLDLGIDPTLRNEQTTQEFLLRGTSSNVAPLSIEAGFIHRALDYSLSSADALEFKQDTGSLGVRWRPSGALTLGVTVRRTEGEYPFAVPGGLPDEFQRDDVDLSAVWTITGASTVTARLSRTREKHDVLTTRDISGNTGAVSWNFKPTGKLNLTADYIRDTGAESTFIAGGGGGAGGGAVPVVNSAPVATTVQLRGDFEITSKLQLVAGLRRLKRELVNTAAIPGTGEDTLVESRLGLNWTPLRSVLVGCSVGREERDASDGALANVLSSSYSATTVRCLAQFRTQ